MAARVMVLEDDEDLREAMSQFLAIVEDAECLSFATVDELKNAAREVLATELALLDINLGFGQPSGIDAYNWLREQSYKGRIVFVTGHAFGHPLVDEARRIGGAAVLAKPVPFDQLTKLIREVAA